MLNLRKVQELEMSIDETKKELIQLNLKMDHFYPENIYIHLVYIYEGTSPKPSTQTYQNNKTVPFFRKI
jgi:hypothetical protein